MTTADGGQDRQHIKSIIHSHHDHHQNDHQKYDSNDPTSAPGGSSNENSPAKRVPKSSSSSFKRVSFGNSKGTVVQTYVYESIPTVEVGYPGPISSTSHGEALADGQGESASSASPSKIKVTTLESQAPVSIHPPAALESSGGDTIGGSASTAERRVQIISPPLHSLRKMEVENPFRPDGQLSHEVDPIVESYKHRPFPTGQHDLVDGSMLPASSSPPPPPNSSSSPLKSSNSRPSNNESTTNGTKTKKKNSSSSSPIKSPPSVDPSSKNAQMEIQHKQVYSAKPGHLEVVHIEGKNKKCGCCSIQ